MEAIPQIDQEEARRLFDSGEAIFVDIRDAWSHGAARIPGSIHLDDRSLQDFLRDTQPDARVVVYCYHGNNSLMGTQALQAHGLAGACSLSGGFEAWRGLHEDAVESSPDTPRV